MYEGHVKTGKPLEFEQRNVFVGDITNILKQRDQLGNVEEKVNFNGYSNKN